MAETIRFRPVTVGSPPHAGETWYVVEDPDGRVFLRDSEWPWLLEGVALETVRLHDFPHHYQQIAERMSILPIRLAAGETGLDAHHDLHRQIEELDRAGVGAESVAA